MNIDNNEMPEPTEEYPSHMVEETADEEEITDHQAVADVLSEGETYENLTLDGLRETVNEILEERAVREDETVSEAVERVEEAQSEPRAVQQIDVSQIPPGMSVEDFVEHYQATGSLLTQATAVPSSYATYTGVVRGVDTSGSTDAAAPIRNPIDDLFVNREDDQKKEPIEEILPTPEEIARIKEERKLYHAGQLKLKREICVRDVNIDKNDLVITFYSGSHTFYHLDIEGTHQMQEAVNPYSIRRRRGSSASKGICTSFIFDKNMNRLILYKDGIDKKKKTRRDGTRIYPSQAYLGSEGGIGDEYNFIVIDKNAFLNSKGRVWKLRYRSKVAYYRIKEVKKMYMGQFDEIERFMSFMKSGIEVVHPAEDYDIMYTFGGNNRHMNYDFALLLKFRDVTISNSIEMDHHIGDFIVKSAGVHHVSHGRTEIRSQLYGSLTGTRLTFTPLDAGRGYQHSHLTTSMHNFGNFCTGSQNYSSGDGYMDEYSLQEHIFRVETFIKWESLEGGPHYRMENINSHRGVQTIKRNILGTDREVGNSYVEKLIYEINQTPDKFATFAPCFTIISQKGNLKFIADYQMFFRKFMEIIPSDKIKQITAQNREKVYTYNSMEGTFHGINDMDSIDPIKIVKKAELNMRGFTPIYISGRYHRPRLATRDIGGLMDGLVFSPEPNIMKEIAQLIMYQLTNKLEEYGNTSENKGREES